MAFYGEVGLYEDRGITYFIVSYVVIGTLSHSKIILELLLQNDKAQAFYDGGRSPLNPPPPEGETPSITPPHAHQE